MIVDIITFLYSCKAHLASNECMCSVIGLIYIVIRHFKVTFVLSSTQFFKNICEVTHLYVYVFL